MPTQFKIAESPSETPDPLMRSAVWLPLYGVCGGCGRTVGLAYATAQAKVIGQEELDRYAASEAAARTIIARAQATEPGRCAHAKG
jgi:hypothetical protein